ncbi:putative ribosomal RNA small subunit methyltransferase A [uncultured archaeon]|nr:putative ribosomal RNA small subunit methyltransferase A [uncultured archaeon]
MTLLPELKRISEQYGFLQKRKLSQNFLVEERVLKREASYCEPEGKTVLEIGPGFGFLTRELALAGAKKVFAIEKDYRLIPVLEDELSSFRNVELINEDFLEAEIPKGVEVVASNVPYSISSPVLFKLAEMSFSRAVLCLQREFVLRMLAKPGGHDYSRLSISSQTAFNLELMERVPRGVFYPPPKVDSSIIRLAPSGEKLSPVEEKLLLNLFQHKKKTVRAALSDSSEPLAISKEKARAIADSSGFSKRRVFSLSRGDLSLLASFLSANQ